MPCSCHLRISVSCRFLRRLDKVNVRLGVDSTTVPLVTKRDNEGVLDNPLAVLFLRHLTRSLRYEAYMPHDINYA